VAESIERLKCPQAFQDRIDRIGGLNRFGGPNFKIIWGQTETIRRAGIDGYIDVLVGFEEACWILQQWKAPEVYGTPTSYFIENYDPATGLQMLGDYPWQGRYETIQPFRWAGLINGRMVKEAMPLNSLIIDLVIPIIKQCEHVSYLTRYAALKDEQDRRSKARQNRIADNLHESLPPWLGAVSYSRQGCKTPLLEKKMQQIQKQWSRAMRFARLHKKGPSIYAPQGA
jgi:hypothetical protein